MGGTRVRGLLRGLRERSLSHSFALCLTSPELVAPIFATPIEVHSALMVCANRFYRSIRGDLAPEVLLRDLNQRFDKVAVNDDQSSRPMSTDNGAIIVVIVELSMIWR